MRFKRTRFTQLPEGRELRNILTKEAKRQVPFEKRNKHYPDFSLIVKLFQKYNLPPDIFTQGWASRDLSVILKKSKILIERLSEKMSGLIEGNQDGNNILFFNKIYDYLSQEDSLEKADLIFVFGAKTLYRIKKGVELYQRKLGNILMLSGGHSSYNPEQKIAEAEIYKEFALKNGVPNANIITEDKSISMPDNVKRSLNLLDSRNIYPRSIILVNSPYDQRRGWAYFEKYLPEGVKLIRVNCESGSEYSRDFWYMNKNGIKAVVNTFIKMKIGVVLNSA